MIVGTAGHIDHGKTALVKALTGVDADRLKEEKARGITIDLGYAYSDLGDGRQLGFVDVPGHERFVHNMLAGATGIDAALLVVSAAEGIKPQTVEHLQIVDLLGLDRGIVALTKTDLANDDQLLERMAEVETLLASTSLKGAEIIPVSAMTGQGVDELKAKLLALGESGKGATGLRAARGRSLLPAVGRGRGRDRHGPCRRDQGRRPPAADAVGAGGARALAACAEPRGRGRPCRRALRAQPERPAALEGCGAARRLGGEPRAARADRPARRAISSCSPRRAQPLKHWSPVHVHLGAAHVMGRVALLEGDRLAPGADGAGAARARGEDRRAGGRPRHPARSVGHPHASPARRWSIRSARRATGARRGGWPSSRALARAERDGAAGAAAAEAGFVDLARFGVARNLRPAEVERLLAEAGGAKVGGLRLPGRDARGGARKTSSTR